MKMIIVTQDKHFTYYQLGTGFNETHKITNSDVNYPARRENLEGLFKRAGIKLQFNI